MHGQAIAPHPITLCCIPLKLPVPTKWLTISLASTHSYTVCQLECDLCQERIYHDLPFASPTTQAAWEAKIIGLAMIFAYSFFKFGWSYRLFNYCSIAIGAVPDGDEDSAERALRMRRAADLNVLAGQHFNAGLRGIFLSIGFMGWFAGPAAFVAASALILVILVRRQFFSRARLAAQGAAA